MINSSTRKRPSFAIPFLRQERAAIVECDQQKMKATVSATVSIEHPFEVNGDDHCETSLEAYRDVVPILKHLVPWERLVG